MLCFYIYIYIYIYMCVCVCVCVCVCRDAVDVCVTAICLVDPFPVSPFTTKRNVALTIFRGMLRLARNRLREEVRSQPA